MVKRAGLGTAEIQLTPSDAVLLFEDKVQSLRGQMNQAARAAKDAIEQRDKAAHEVQELQTEKSNLIEENVQIKEDAQRIRDGLAQHRSNVEASLDKQEKAANVVIEQSKVAEQKAKASEGKVLQLRSQVDGIKATLRSELDNMQLDFSKVFKAIGDAIDAIPDSIQKE